MIFQVTGLPRSGTAFMATLLNLHPMCFAHHDLAAEREDWREHSESLERDHRYVGEVSTYGWLPKATRRDGPKVVIDRDPLAVVQSMNETLGKTHDIGPYRNTSVLLRQWAQAYNALVVPFEHLFKVDILAAVWHRLFGEAGSFPLAKVQQIVTMNIQRQNPEQMLGDAEEARRRLFT